MSLRKKNLSAGLAAILILLSLPLLSPSETIDELEDRLNKVTASAEKLECLAVLVERCMQEAPRKAIEYGNQALRLLKDFPDDRKKIKVLNGICWASGLLGKFREALDHGREAEILARRLDDKEQLAVTFGSIANIYLYLSDFYRALDYALKARDMSESLGYRSGEVSALVSIARVYRNLKDYTRALANYEKAMKISEELGNKRGVARILGNMGNVYWNLKQYPRALEFYNRGLKIMKEEGSEVGGAQMMYNIACVYSETGKHDQALQYDMKLLKLFKKAGNKGNLAYVLGSIGRDYSRLKNYPLSLDYLGRSLKLSGELGLKDTIRVLYEEYTHVYESMGNYERALHFHKKFKDASEKILNDDRNKRIAHLQVVYDVDKKQKENQLLKKNNHIQKLKLDRQRLALDHQKLLRNFLALVSVLVFIIALVTYNRYRIRKKTEQVLRLSEQKLKNLNAAKDRLFTIIAHDLASPLNSLLLSAGHLKNHYPSLEQEDLREFILNIYRQTRDLAELLENLLQWAVVQIGKIEVNPEAVDLYSLTEEILKNIKFAAQKKEIRLSSQVTEQATAWADKNMTAAVLRNLLSNAVKYTRPGGEISVMSKDAGKWVELTVSDNGIGIDRERVDFLLTQEVNESTRGTSNEKGTGLGLVLCREFVEMNGGEIRVKTRPEQGSDFSFTLPKPHSY